MKYMVIDTSSKAASTAIFQDQELLGSCLVNTTMTHSQKLMPLIHTVLEQTQLKVGDIDAYYVCEGPGSFTGVRIGIATIIGLAQPTKKEMYTFSSMFLLASGIRNHRGLIVSLIDAKRTDVYFGVYTWREGTLMTLEEGVEALPTLLEVLSEKYPNESILFVGDALIQYAEAFENLKHSSCLLATVNESIPRADQLAIASVPVASKTDVSHVKANYMRKSQAERDQ